MALVSSSPEKPYGPVDLVRAVVHIHQEKRTGVLEVIGEEVRAYLYFIEGTAVYAEEGTLGETLGRILVREGVLTFEQYAQIIRVMTESLFDNEQMRFGEVGVQLGLLTPHQVNEGLASQVQLKVMRCLSWPSIGLAFNPDPEALDEVQHFPASIEQILLEGLRRYFDAERTNAVLAPSMGAYPRLTAPAGALGPRLGLVPAETRFVRSLDGGCTLADALAAAPLDPLLATQIAAGLVLFDLVDFDVMPRKAEPVARAPASPATRAEPAAPPPPAPRTPTAEPAAPVAQEPSAPVTQAEPAVVASRRIEHDPVAERERRGAALRKTAEAVLRARRARGKPIRERPSARPVRPAGERRAKVTAEAALHRAQRYMRNGAWAPALHEIDQARSLCPEEVEYALYAAWAHFSLGTADTSEATLRAKLEHLVKKALRENRELAFGYYVRGRLALLDGDDDRAERSFRIAIKLDPDNREAQSHLRLLQGRRGK